MISLDDLDHRLLSVLQDDARLSNQALAERVGTSPATALRRVRRLEEAAVIERTVAILNPEALGTGLTVIAEIVLDRQGAEHQAAFAELACSRPEVQQCYQVSPGPDFILIAQVGDMPAWQRLAQEFLTQQANVRNVKAYFSIRRHRFRAGWPLAPTPAGC